MTTPNLDQKAAQYAQKIVAAGGGDIENLITKTLGVLQEQGVYACLLFLFSRSDSEKPTARIVREQLRAVLEMLSNDYSVQWKKDEQGQNVSVPTSAEEDRTAKEVLAFFSDSVCGDLDTLLLVRELYEQTLIYARYGAKAAGK